MPGLHLSHSAWTSVLAVLDLLARVETSPRPYLIQYPQALSAKAGNLGPNTGHPQSPRMVSLICLNRAGYDWGGTRDNVRRRESLG